MLVDELIAVSDSVHTDLSTTTETQALTTEEEVAIVKTAHNHWLAMQIPQKNRVLGVNNSSKYPLEAGKQYKPNLVPYNTMAYINSNLNDLKKDPVKGIADLIIQLRNDLSVANIEDPSLPSLSTLWEQDRYKILIEIQNGLASGAETNEYKMAVKEFNQLLDDIAEKIHSNDNWIKTANIFIELATEQQITGVQLLEQLKAVQKASEEEGFVDVIEQVLLNADNSITKLMAIAHFNWRLGWRSIKGISEQIDLGDLNNLTLEAFNKNTETNSIKNTELQKLTTRLKYILADYNLSVQEVEQQIASLRDDVHKTNSDATDTYLFMFKIIEQIRHQILTVPKNSERENTLKDVLKNMATTIMMDLNAPVTKLIADKLDPYKALKERV